MHTKIPASKKDQYTTRELVLVLTGERRRERGEKGGKERKASSQETINWGRERAAHVSPDFREQIAEKEKELKLQKKNQIAKKKHVHTMFVRVSSPLLVMSRNSSSLITFFSLHSFFLFPITGCCGGDISPRNMV